MIDFQAALTHGWPDCRCSVDGNSYEGIIWPSKSVPKPTLEQIEIAWADYLNTKRPREDAMRDLRSSDSSMARVVEDLIDVLENSNTLAKSDLPVNVQKILSDRKKLRDVVNRPAG